MAGWADSGHSPVDLVPIDNNVVRRTDRGMILVRVGGPDEGAANEPGV